MAKNTIIDLMENTDGNLDSKKLLKVSRVADLLDLSRSQVYALIQENSIPVVRVGRAIRIRADVVQQLAEKGTAQ